MEPVRFHRGCAAWKGRLPLRGRRAQARALVLRACARVRKASIARHNGTPHPKGTRSQQFSCKSPHIHNRRTASLGAPKSPRAPRRTPGARGSQETPPRPQDLGTLRTPDSSRVPGTPKRPSVPRPPRTPRFFMKPSISPSTASPSRSFQLEPFPSRPLRVNREELAAHHDIHVFVRREVRRDCIGKYAGYMAVCGSAID